MPHYPALQFGLQGTAQIHGTVQDASGAAVPGAEVKATQTDTNASRSATTGADGGYVLANLPIGPYRIEVAKDGFSKYQQAGVVLQVNADPLVDVSLKVGAQSEIINVEANAALVETRSSTVGAVMDNQRILELPLNGRNATELITLSGGAVSLDAGGSQALGGRSFGGTPRIQVAGGLGYGTAYTLDGAMHINFSSMGSVSMPFPDALQEFKVETTGVGSNTKSANSVSAVTKSGTNQLHATLFEFFRNNALNGRNYFATSPNTLKRNQFGGVVGGAIKKDKLFFFAGYQYTFNREDPASQEAFLPTPQMLAGDWSTYASAACKGSALALGGAFSGNTINPASYSPAGLAIVNRILAQAPTPNNCGRVTFSRPTPSNQYQPVGRLDWVRSDKETIFVRYMSHSYQAPTAFSLSPNNLLTSTAAGNDNLAQAWAVGDTYVFNASIVNSLRLSMNRIYSNQLGTQFFSACDVNIKVYCGYVPKRFVLAGSGGAPSLGTSMDVGDAVATQNIQADEEIGWVKGSHQFSFGANFRFMQAHLHDNFIDAPRFTINGSGTRDGLADLMTGRLATLVAGGPYYISMVQWGAGFFAGDTWKATQRLTVNYGVRWEPFLPQRILGGTGISNFSLARFNAGTKSGVYPNAPAGWSYTGDPGVPGDAGITKKWNQFSPRLGLAWDPMGDGKTSIRASYSLSYSVVGINWRDDPSQTSPWANAMRVTNVSLDDPWANFAGGNPFPLKTGAGAQFVPFGDYISTPPDISTPRTNSWNLTVQRQVGRDWLVSASYLGSSTNHIWIHDSGNPAVILPGVPVSSSCAATASATTCAGPANLNLRRRFTIANPTATTQMGNVAILDAGGTMNYHGMLISANKRLSQNVSVQANYTWSHCISDSIDLTASGPDAGEVNTKPGDRKFDRGDCNGDRRHLFNLTTVAVTPKFANRTTNMLASGWTLSVIYRFQSGQPLNILAGTDAALNGNVGLISGTSFERGNQISAQAYGPGSGYLSRWLNPAAFAVPALGTLGNYRRNSVVGPGLWNFDLALSREFRITERQRIELRGEAFNITNSYRPNVNAGGAGGTAMNLTAGNALFGQIRNAQDPRIIQLALKYQF
ncbi:MAG: carboxypeptidase regulatory-like domain-containing protein [Bryobacteraceae bacterium]